MEKLQGTSMDIVQDNMEKLKQIFPEVFTEGKIDFEVLKQLLGEKIENDKERYSFTWKGKAEARQIAQDTSTGTLRPSKEDSKDWENTENLYIEGDNLEVLKLLQKSYHGKIKMIYIDPPYNTGKDFVYKDNFRDNIDNYLTITGQKSGNSTGGGYKLSTNTESNGRYHSDWLSMMYPRLKLARNLLTDDGVIFISIDDYEIENILAIANEIFGEENRVGIIHRRKNRKPHNAGNTMSMSYEFIIAYYKKNKFKLGQEFSEMYSDEKGNYAIYPIIKADKKERIYTFNAGLYCECQKLKKGVILSSKNRNLDIEILDEGIISNNILQNDIKIKARYCLTNENGKLSSAILNKNIYFNINGVPKEKRYRTEEDYKIDNHHWDIEKGKNEDGDEEIKNIFNIEGKNFLFEYPKPINLLKKALSVVMENNFIILDFFSGSSTTAHAVMQLNSEDGGNRKYIMVQLPEVCDEKSEAYKAGYKNICEIGKERIRRAGELIKEEIEKENSQLKLGEEPKKVPDIGFKIFKLDSSNIKEWDSETEDLKQSLFDSIDNIKSDRSSLDILYEILLKYGLDLNVPIIENDKFYSIGGGTLLINLDREIDMEVIDSICEEYKNLLEIDEDFKTMVVLRDSAFKNDVDKTNAMKKLEQVGIKEVRSI